MTVGKIPLLSPGYSENLVEVDKARGGMRALFYFVEFVMDAD